MNAHAHSHASHHSLGFVVIGRNEGQRLRACFESLLRSGPIVRHSRAGGSPEQPIIVYVDSASTDDSVEIARSFDIETVQLDASKPYTAARSRNAGIRKLLELHPRIDFIMAIDGDCELCDNFIARALQTLVSTPNAAIVCGRRRERHPDASIFNRLCDMEWNTQPGLTQSCGGDALIRAAAFTSVGGYDESLIAGEEPEMCLRLRLMSWTIYRIDCDMTLHDARLTRFSQWWKRAVRAGHAYAEGKHRHGRSHGYNVKPVRSAVEWALILPVMAMALAWPTWGLSLLIPVFAYAWLWLRVRNDRISTYNDVPAHASLYASYIIFSKFAELQGMLMFWLNRARGRRTGLIEYKSAASHDHPSSTSRTLNPESAAHSAGQLNPTLISAGGRRL